MNRIHSAALKMTILNQSTEMSVLTSQYVLQQIIRRVGSHFCGERNC